MRDQEPLFARCAEGCLRGGRKRGRRRTSRADLPGSPRRAGMPFSAMLGELAWCKEPIGAVDLLPTLCEIGEVALSDGARLDGTSFAPLLKTDAALVRETPLIWFYYSARGYAHFALRDGDYMMLARRTQDEKPPGRPAPGRAEDDARVGVGSAYFFGRWILRQYANLQGFLGGNLTRRPSGWCSQSIVPS